MSTPDPISHCSIQQNQERPQNNYIFIPICPMLNQPGPAPLLSKTPAHQILVTSRLHTIAIILFTLQSCKKIFDIDQSCIYVAFIINLDLINYPAARGRGIKNSNKCRFTTCHASHFPRPTLAFTVDNSE